MATEVTEEDVTNFVLKFWRSSNDQLNPEDVLGSLGIDGDDVDEFLIKYREKYGVDLNAYRWYFHHGEEGHNIGGLFFPPPDARVERIPISIGLLTASARTGRWQLQYPEHFLPPKRYDIMINQGCLIISVSLLLAYCASQILAR